MKSLCFAAVDLYIQQVSIKVDEAWKITNNALEAPFCILCIRLCHLVRLRATLDMNSDVIVRMV